MTSAWVPQDAASRYTISAALSLAVLWEARSWQQVLPKAWPRKTGTSMFSTNHYELVISNCKKLEQMLEDGLGASGRGLHEKVSSVQDSLPAPLVKRLRYIASIRNKLVHESDSNRLDDANGYREACRRAETELKQLLRPKRVGCMPVVMAFVAVGLLYRWL